MAQEALYHELALHFQQRAAVRALEDQHRHADAGLISFLEALLALAAFVPPVLAYVAEHVGKHLLDRATDALLEKAKVAAEDFSSTAFNTLRSNPNMTFSPRVFDEVASKADEFSEILIHQSALLEPEALENALELGRISAQKLLSEQLKFENDAAYRLTLSMVIDIRRSVHAAADKSD